MKTRILPVLLLIAVAMVSIGCPARNLIRSGTWLFTFADGGNGQPITLAVKLLAGGTANHDFPTLPPGADGVLGPTLTWQQLDETFSMTQVSNRPFNDFQYSGTVLSRTLIQGTVVGTNNALSSTFVASWLER